MATLDPAIATSISNGATSLSLINGFGALMALQQVFNDEYQWNQDYLTRSVPPYFPYLNYWWQPLKAATIAPDNACAKTYYYDANYPSVSKLEYDYIVVGSGPGGSVVANRLSENPNVKVLLVEAGQDPIYNSAVPQFFPFMLKNSRTWDYKGEIVNSSSNAFTNGSDLTGGKMLGGTTGTNAMIFVCGTDRDYNTWASMGNPGWNYTNLLPFFKKFENNTNNSTVQYKNGTCHGVGGPLTVSDYGSTDSFIQVLKDGFNQTGYKFLRDWNSREYNGLVETQGTVKNGERMSAARAFLIPARNRTNLTVMKGSVVEKVLFTGTKAIGVNIVTKDPNCLNIKVYARKEVILSAGAFGTPKILLKSGIGRPADLTPFSIPLVKSLAVGENYQDHVKSIHFLKVNPNAQPQTVLDIGIDATQYLFTRTGKFSNLNVQNYNGFINTTDPNATYPDAHLIFYRFEKSQEFIREVLDRFTFKPQFADQIIALNNQSQILMVFNEVVNPVARGKVSLRSTNVDDLPRIVTNFLDNAADVNNMLRGYQKIEDLANTPAFQSVSAEIVKFDIPECNPLPYPSDAYRRCYIKYFTATQWHASGTSKMGPSTDPNAVVDARLRVYGIQGLRVADASIMPNVITSNTQCAVYMIGEKAAAMIKEDNP